MVFKNKIQKWRRTYTIFEKLKVRMALRDVKKSLGLSYGHVDRICKMVPFDPSRPLTLQESIDREPRFKDEIAHVKVKKLLDLSQN